MKKTLPDFVQEEEHRINREVDIDACLVEIVEAMWDAGIVTRSVCCGHGDGRAEVVVRQLDAAKAHHILKQRGAVLYWDGETLREHDSSHR